jgi:hypothetical protein
MKRLQKRKQVKRLLALGLLLTLAVLPGQAAHAASTQVAHAASPRPAPNASSYFLNSPTNNSTVHSPVTFTWSWAGGGGCCELMNVMVSTDGTHFLQLGNSYQCNLNCGSGTASKTSSMSLGWWWWKVCNASSPYNCSSSVWKFDVT